MKKIKSLFVIVLFLATLALATEASAQCAMCSLNAENSVTNGNTQGKGLNDGILYLLAAPYVAVACVAFLWYKKYRKKSVDLNIRDQKINLN